MQIAFPYRYDANRMTALADEPAHIRQMLELLLFTMPGERVNRPDFGCGIQRMVFSAQSAEVRATLQALVEAEIHRSLGDVLALKTIEVTTQDAKLHATIEYQLAHNDTAHVERFVRNP
jgi:uncharacterized protein